MADKGMRELPVVKHKIGTCLTPEGNICDICQSKYDKVKKSWKWLYEQGYNAGKNSLSHQLEAIEREVEGLKNNKMFHDRHIDETLAIIKKYKEEHDC